MVGIFKASYKVSYEKCNEKYTKKRFEITDLPQIAS